MEFLKVLFMKMILTAKTNFGELKENSIFLIFVPDISVWNIEQEDKLYVFQTEISGIN